LGRFWKNCTWNGFCQIPCENHHFWLNLLFSWSKPCLLIQFYIWIIITTKTVRKMKEDRSFNSARLSFKTEQHYLSIINSTVLQHTCRGGTGERGEKTENVSRGWAGHANTDHGSSSSVAKQQHHLENRTEYVTEKTNKTLWNNNILLFTYDCKMPKNIAYKTFFEKEWARACTTDFILHDRIQK